MPSPCAHSPEIAVCGANEAPGGEYLAALEYLFGLINYERVSTTFPISRSFRLDRMRALLQALGSPQQSLPAIHIAGTKGKGSTAAMLAGMLEAGGLRAGLFTSPHIQHFEERMTVNGQQPSATEIVRLTKTVRSAAENVAVNAGYKSPTFFEVTTAMSWLYFQSKRADLVVLETGLGGRLDATNVCQPLLTMITNISRDHMHLLGDSLVEIAVEKAGIIKPGIPVVSGVTDADARTVIARVAREKSAPLVQLGETLHQRNARCGSPSGSGKPEHWTGDIETPVRIHSDVSAPLAGAHQLANAALALAALDLIRQRGFHIEESAEREGLHRVRWPLRIEVICERPLVIVDAAHNDASIQALLQTIAGIPAKRRRLIFGTSRDKDATEMLRMLAGQFDDVVLTRYVSNPRAFPVEDLGEIARDNGIEEFTLHTDPRSAWEDTFRQSGDDDLICVAGSFFLAAEIRELLGGNSAFPSVAAGWPG